MSSDQVSDEVLRWYHHSDSLERLALETGIPAETIRLRVRAAACCFLSLGTDRCFPVHLDRLRPMTVDWDLLWFD